MSPGLQGAMTVPSEEELDSFKYSDLQNLAKSLGLRANLRADKLLKTLKAHLKPEAKKKGNLNENQTSAFSYDKDENRTFAFSCEATEIQVSQEQAEGESVGHVTKTRRRRRKTVHGNPKTQENGSVQAEGKQDHSKIKVSDPAAFQTQEKQEEVPSLPDQSQGDEKAISSGKGNEDSKGPSEKRPQSMDGFSNPGNNKRTATAAITPNFKRLHEAHFRKMESIDEYVVRKKKHFKEHTSLNELKKPPGKKEGGVTPVPPRRRLTVACTPTSQCLGPANPNTMYLKGSVKQSALSATKMNVRFSAATKDNEHKRSLTKTPSRKSPHVILSGSSPSKAQAVLRTPKLKNKENSAEITPFKLATIAMQTPGSNKKPVFDLKASLSRPLNYEPHKGKLKPWGQSKESNSLNEHGSRVSFHKKTYKQPCLQTREEQRKKHEQERKKKKEKVLQARRGLVTAQVQ